MCGRFALYTSLPEMLKLFGPDSTIDNLERNYNVTPSQSVPIAILVKNRIRLGFMKWGFPMFWDKTKNKDLVNIRYESLDKKVFLPSFEKRRCIIPANGFFEWEKGTKQPFYIYPKNKRMIGFAGIYYYNKKDDLSGFAILTQDANSNLQKIHHRMPVIIEIDQFSDWLNSGEIYDNELTKGLSELISNPVSRNVNKPAFNVPELIEPVLE